MNLNLNLNSVPVWVYSGIHAFYWRFEAFKLHKNCYVLIPKNDNTIQIKIHENDFETDPIFIKDLKDYLISVVETIVNEGNMEQYEVFVEMARQFSIEPLEVPFPNKEILETSVSDGLYFIDKYVEK